MVDEQNFKDPSIILADRGYESFNVYEHINRAGQKFVIHAKDIISNGFLSNSVDLPKPKLSMSRFKFLSLEINRK